MNTGSFDSSRLFTIKTGPSCNSCPSCDCGDYALNDTWYHEYQTDDDISDNQARCSKCVCTKDINGNLIADCDTASVYDIGDATCDVNDGQIYNDQRFECHVSFQKGTGSA